MDGGIGRSIYEDLDGVRHGIELLSGHKEEAGNDRVQSAGQEGSVHKIRQYIRAGLERLGNEKVYHQEPEQTEADSCIEQQSVKCSYIQLDDCLYNKRSGMA